MSDVKDLKVSGRGGHEKHPPLPRGPPQGPRYSPTAGSNKGFVSYERGTPLCASIEGDGSSGLHTEFQ